MKNDNRDWILVLIGIIADVLSIVFAESGIKSFLKTFVHDQTLADKLSGFLYWLLILAITIAMFFLLIRKITPISIFLFRKLGYVFKLDIETLKLAEHLQNNGIKSVNINEASDGKRLVSYEELRGRTKHSLLIVGVGSTNFSQNRGFIEELLRRKTTLKILMQSPTLIQNPDFEKIFGKSYFSEYFSRVGYENEIISSYNRLKRTCLDYRTRGFTSNEIEMKEYMSFYPINLTARDIDYPDAELIVEFCYPLVTERVRLHITKEDNNRIFEICINSIKEMYKKALTTV